MYRPRTLRAFILSAAAVAAIGGLIGLYLVVSAVYSDTVRKDAQHVSSAIAEQTFASMFQVMRQGWTREQLEAFIDGTQDAFKETPYTVGIYRGEKVEALFGKIEQPTLDQQVVAAFEDGERRRVEEDSQIRYVYPLAAREECLQCHTNAKQGDVLGVISVSQDIGPLLSEARGDFLTASLLLAPLPIVLAILVATYIHRRVNRSITRLQDNIERVNRVSDLKDLAIRDIDLGFEELNDILGQVDKLTDRLRGFAVDKDLLEFEIRLLERFVITSDVVNDWREYVRQLLMEINQVLDTYTMFSIFKVEEEVFDLEVFWRDPPSDRTRSLLEAEARRTVEGQSAFGDIELTHINHHVAYSDAEPLELQQADIEVATKSLVVESPKIGGIVGIGVQADISKDPVRLLVVESVLSTLLNVVGSVKAISKYTRDLEYYATRDPLTNLYNQRVFWDLLEYEKGRSERHGDQFALLIIDLDNFKSVNDTFGHETGDRLLQAFAEELRYALRKGDVTARYGGDEFVAILPDIDRETPYNVANRIVGMANQPLIEAKDGTPIKATVSVGVALHPVHATDMKDLFLFADNMMYKAKSEGKNRIAIPSEEDVIEAFHQVNQTMNLVQQALEEQWVIPYFQPIACSKTGEPHAFEVLSRIRRPDGRIVSAGEYIETAERMGIVHQMDFKVMEKALKIAADMDYRGKLFLNISPKALVLNEFFPTVNRICQETGISPGQLVFELTERETVRNQQMLEKFVRRLNLEGFKFAVDDFGSGFSSFHYIKRFPIDYIKLEGDFVVNMMNDPRDRAFVESISMLAHNLKIHTIAEFVESEEVKEAVSHNGVDYVQGFHVGRPSPELAEARPCPAD